ncbi:MAG TPA: AbrB family transcriptional regulator [Chloroflexota bacterium]|nr:AbrB family transcriptional regulator [Chloroflexota bacterium]
MVIPAQIRSRLGLQRGDHSEIESRSDELILKRLPRRPLLRLRGAFKGPESLTDRLLNEHQSAR